MCGRTSSHFGADLSDYVGWTRCTDECDHDGPFLIQYGETLVWDYYDGGAEASTLLGAGFRVMAQHESRQVPSVVKEVGRIGGSEHLRRGSGAA